jgi:hypothetical protein
MVEIRTEPEISWRGRIVGKVKSKIKNQPKSKIAYRSLRGWGT